jgi:cell division protein FtsB
MDVLYTLRARARQIIGPVLGFALCAYFAYHLVEGDRGLLALWNLQTQVRDAKATLARRRMGPVGGTRGAAPGQSP